MGWAVVQVILFVISIAITIASRPKIPSPKAQAFDAQSLPIAEEGSTIPVLFGTRDITSATVAWYGHVTVVPIKSKSGKKG